MLLKSHAHSDERPRGLARWLGGFNRGFDAAAERYGMFTRAGARRTGRLLVIYGLLVAATVWGFRAVPSGFVPAQDKYFLVGIVQLPAGSSLDRTEAVTREMTRLALDQPGVESVVAFPGLSINGFVSSPSAAVLFAMLDSFEQRKDKSLSAGAIAGALNGKFGAIDEGFVAMFPPPPVPGLGATGGFKLQIQDRAQRGHPALNDALQRVMAAAGKDPRIAGLFSGYQVNVPLLAVDVDREKAKAWAFLSPPWPRRCRSTWARCTLPALHAAGGQALPAAGGAVHAGRLRALRDRQHQCRAGRRRRA